VRQKNCVCTNVKFMLLVLVCEVGLDILKEGRFMKLGALFEQK